MAKLNQVLKWCYFVIGRDVMFEIYVMFDKYRIKCHLYLT
jgi:hypothetical protein